MQREDGQPALGVSSTKNETATATEEISIGDAEKQAILCTLLSLPSSTKSTAESYVARANSADILKIAIATKISFVPHARLESPLHITLIAAVSGSEYSGSGAQRRGEYGDRRRVINRVAENGHEKYFRNEKNSRHRRCLGGSFKCPHNYSVSS
jgi:hypothetical protein